jgi:asparagine synthase (glutamine-hydrolysing)
MCGFTGFLGGNLFADAGKVKATITAMADAIIHRGPDSSGTWQDNEQKIALAHRRLSILDLSDAGHQPMASLSGRYIIIFNGEIYNHLELRKELSGNWRGHSDTETLLAGFDILGIEATIKKSIGMFAFAIWDRHEQILTLGRDRLGEKPLYYGWQGENFLFGSELKALRAHSEFSAEIDRNSLTLFMRHAYIPAPYSIYKNIAKLPPASLLTVSLKSRQPVIKTYWSGAETARNSAVNKFSGTKAQAVDALEDLLKDAIKQQMVADVPLGAFLSGGIDSSTVVALMQAQSTRPIKTFTIGFHEEAYNEAIHAAAVAGHLGTEHTELYVTPQQAMAVIPKLPALYDEPFADSSQIPTFLVAELAKKHVTVSLSGDAGDELFCGYNRYKLTAAIWNKISHFPLPLRKVLAGMLTAISPATWDKIADSINFRKFANPGDKIHKGANTLNSKTIGDLYIKLVSQYNMPEELVIGGHEPATLLTGNMPDLSGLNDIEKMMALDLLTYLPDDILVKVDRAAMGVSLETRAPLLDHRVVEFAWKLPMEYKLRDGVTKSVLRDVLYRHVPRELIERPKMGFGVPIDRWLRTELRDWAEDLISERRLKQEGYLDPVPIREKWAEHLSGKRNWQHQLWNVLMFQAWLREQK